MDTTLNYRDSVARISILIVCLQHSIWALYEQAIKQFRAFFLVFTKIFNYRVRISRVRVVNDYEEYEDYEEVFHETVVACSYLPR